MNIRCVLLSEIIKELQDSFDKNGECEVKSIGTSSGSNSSYIFHTAHENRSITIRAFRNKKKGGC